MNIYNLIIKFFAGEISESELILLKSWLEQDPKNRQFFNEENELWQEASLSAAHENYNPDTGWMNLSSRLGLEKSAVRSFTILNKNYFRLLIAAATVACLVAIGGISVWIAGKKSLRRAGTYTTIVTTNEGEKSHVLLPDSTTIFLNAGSKLEYNGLYNIKERKIIFKGEAYFDVHTNPEKPFLVDVTNMEIVATGTRFNVLSYDNEDRVETTLEEGKVKVLIKGHESIQIKPGEQIVYSKQSGKIEVHKVSIETYTSWKENKLRFINTPFEEALRRIARKYNVTFKITDKDLLNLKYTATFIDESIEEVMQMLKVVSPITYKIYTRTTINDKQYLKPEIVVGKRKTTN